MSENPARTKDEIPLVFDENFLDLVDRGGRATIEISSDGYRLLVSARAEEDSSARSMQTAR